MPNFARAAIVSILLTKYIRTPSGDNRKDVEGFEHKWGFSQCADAVDGTHIPIASPEECPADTIIVNAGTQCLCKEL